MDTFSTIGASDLAHIVSFLDYPSLCSLELTGYTLYQQCKNPLLWNSILTPLSTQFIDVLQSLKYDVKFLSYAAQSTSADLILQTITDIALYFKKNGKKVIELYPLKDCYYLLRSFKYLISVIYEHIRSLKSQNRGIVSCDESLEHLCRRSFMQFKSMFPVHQGGTETREKPYSTLSKIDDGKAQEKWLKLIGSTNLCPFSAFWHRMLYPHFKKYKITNISKCFLQLFELESVDDLVTTYKWNLLLCSFGPYDEFFDNFRLLVLECGFVGYLSLAATDSLFSYLKEESQAQQGIRKNKSVAILRWGRSHKGLDVSYCTAECTADKSKVVHHSNSALRKLISSDGSVSKDYVQAGAILLYLYSKNIKLAPVKYVPNKQQGTFLDVVTTLHSEMKSIWVHNSFHFKEVERPLINSLGRSSPRTKNSRTVSKISFNWNTSMNIGSSSLSARAHTLAEEKELGENNHTHSQNHHHHHHHHHRHPNVVLTPESTSSEQLMESVEHISITDSQNTEESAVFENVESIGVASGIQKESGSMMIRKESFLMSQSSDLNEDSDFPPSSYTISTADKMNSSGNYQPFLSLSSTKDILIAPKLSKKDKAKSTNTYPKKTETSNHKSKSSRDRIRDAESPRQQFATTEPFTALLTNYTTYIGKADSSPVSNKSPSLSNYVTSISPLAPKPHSLTKQARSPQAEEDSLASSDSSSSHSPKPSTTVFRTPEPSQTNYLTYFRRNSGSRPHSSRSHSPLRTPPNSLSPRLTPAVQLTVTTATEPTESTSPSNDEINPNHNPQYSGFHNSFNAFLAPFRSYQENPDQERDHPSPTDDTHRISPHKNRSPVHHKTIKKGKTEELKWFHQKKKEIYPLIKEDNDDPKSPHHESEDIDSHFSTEPRIVKKFDLHTSLDVFKEKKHPISRRTSEDNHNFSFRKFLEKSPSSPNKGLRPDKGGTKKKTPTPPDSSPLLDRKIKPSSSMNSVGGIQRKDRSGRGY